MKYKGFAYVEKLFEQEKLCYFMHNFPGFCLTDLQRHEANFCYEEPNHSKSYSLYLPKFPNQNFLSSLVTIGQTRLQLNI